MTGYQKIFIGILLILALGIRIHAALDHKITFIDRGDAHGLDQIAMNLALGKGYRFGTGEGEPTAWSVPLYPLFLSGIYRTVGHSYFAVQIVQAFLSTFTVLLMTLWAHTLFGSLSACLAAFIASIYPAFYAYYFSSPSIGTETLYVFLLTASLFTFYGYLKRPSWIRATVSGFLWGLANLTRPMSLSLLLLLPLLLVLLRYPLRTVIRYCGTVWGVVVLVFLPWTIRNYLVFHQFVPLSSYSGGGPAIWGAYHPENRDGFGANVFHEIYMPEDERLKSLGMSETERSKYFLTQGLGYIKDDPAHALRLFVRRGLLYLDPRTMLDTQEGKRQIVTWGYLFVLAGAAMAFFLSLKRQKYRREILSLGLIFGYFLLFHGFLGASERYRFPTEPILIILASFSLSFLPFFHRQGKL